MPIAYGAAPNGDLRAEWNAECTKTVGNKPITVNYKINWPFNFGNPSPADECDNLPSRNTTRAGKDVRPILTAAEYIPPSSWYVPEEIIPSGRRQVIDIPVRSGTHPATERTVYRFEYPPIHNIEFGISGNNISVGNGVTGEYDAWYTSPKFVDPAPVVINNEERDAILQAVADPITGEKDTISEKVDDRSILASEEIYHNDITNII